MSAMILRLVAIFLNCFPDRFLTVSRYSSRLIFRFLKSLLVSVSHSSIAYSELESDKSRFERASVGVTNLTIFLLVESLLSHSKYRFKLTILLRDLSISSTKFSVFCEICSFDEISFPLLLLSWIID